MTHLKSHISTTTIPLQIVNEDTSAGQHRTVSHGHTRQKQLNNLKTTEHDETTHTIRYGTELVSLNGTQHKTAYSSQKVKIKTRTLNTSATDKTETKLKMKTEAYILHTSFT